MNGINVFMFNPIPLSIKHLLHQSYSREKTVIRLKEE